MTRLTNVAILAAVGTMLAMPVALSADTKVKVTFYSDPAGATIYQGAQRMGSAPYVLEYKAPGRFKECLKLLPLKFRWASGAEVEVADLQACPANGKKQQYSVFRPTGIAGAEIDAQFAVALMQQLDAAAAAAQARSDATDEVIRRQFESIKRCTTTVIGNQVFTNCS